MIHRDMSLSAMSECISESDELGTQLGYVVTQEVDGHVTINLVSHYPGLSE